MGQPGTNILLAACAVLVGFGILTIAVSRAFS
jgi:hypothetical protein